MIETRPLKDSNEEIVPYRKLSIGMTLFISVLIIAVGNFLLQFAIMGIHVFIEMMRLGIYSYKDSQIRHFIQTFFTDSRMISETMIISDLASVLFILLFVKHRITKNVKSYLGLNKVKLWGLLFWMLFMFGLFFLTDIISVKAGLSEPEFSKFMRDILNTESKTNLIILLLAVSIAAPVFEEFMFRGFMYSALLQSPVGRIGAIIIPALLWSVIHFQYELIWVAIIFLVGVVFGLARHLTNSVYTVIAMHSLNNLLSFLEAIK